MEKDIPFKKSKDFTLGLELEFQLLDPNDMSLTSKALEILTEIPDQYSARIKPEFIQSMVEVNTRVCQDINQAAKDLKSTIRFLEDRAKDKGCLIYASSLHPFSAFDEQRLYPDPRYKSILHELQIVGKRLITQGLHCHVGLSSPSKTIRVFDGLRPFLPLLLAISGSSPYLDGKDTGFSSFRSKLFDALPRSGMPDALGSWESYCQLVLLLKKCGIIQQPRDIWWDVRPSPDFGTIEVRICDIPSRFQHIIALAALIQALVYAISEEKISPLSMHIAVILNNKWQAARHGLEGTFVDEERFEKTRMGNMLLRLLEELKPAFQALGSSDYLPVLVDMVNQGTTSARFRKMLGQEQKIAKVMERLRRDFWTSHKGT